MIAHKLPETQRSLYEAINENLTRPRPDERDGWKDTNWSKRGGDDSFVIVVLKYL